MSALHRPIGMAAGTVAYAGSNSWRAAPGLVFLSKPGGAFDGDVRFCWHKKGKHKTE